MLGRARRSAMVRTRLPLERILEALEPLAEGGDPDKDRFTAHGWFLGGTLGESDFQLQYRTNSAKNAQTYVVTGVVGEEQGWRIVRLELVARDPWMSPVTLGLLPLLLLVPVYTGDISLPRAGAIVGGVSLLYAVANLLFVPTVAEGRVAALLAARIRGSVRRGSEWLVP